MNTLSKVLAAACLLFPLSTAGADSLKSRMLPTGQLLTPAGRQISVSGTLPLNMVVFPGGRYAAVNCSGGVQGIGVVDLSTGREMQFVADQKQRSAPGEETRYIATGSNFYGLALSTDGKTLFASEGALDAIGVFSVGPNAELTRTGEVAVPSGDPKDKNIIGGLAVGHGVVYAVCTHTDRLAIVPLPANPAVVTNGPVNPIVFVPVDGFPLAVSVQPKSGAVYVTSAENGGLTVVDPLTQKTVSISTGAAPDALAFSGDGAHLWVANGDSDTVSCVDTSTNKVVSSVLVRPDSSRGLPAGGPEGLALSPDGRTLYVAMADLNAVASLKVSADGTWAVLTGYVPVGWYPTSVAVSSDGKSVFVLNAKGSQTRHPNPDGPNANGKGNLTNYVLALLKGSISEVPVSTFSNPNRGLYPVLADNQLSSVVRPDQVSAMALLKSLPIKHVMYIIKENRTYDQVLGDIKQGNGDSLLTLFGANVTPNEHAISTQFALLDNFYCCAEVSADGWNWSSSGYASPYVERTVPDYYREGETRAGHKADPSGLVISGADYDYEGQNRNVSVSLKGDDDVAESPAGYIWDMVAKYKLPYWNFGCFLASQDNSPTKPALVGHTDPNFSPFDLDYSDSDAWVKLGVEPPSKTKYGPDAQPSRFSAWRKDFDQRVAEHTLPAFEVIRFMRDHTSGTTPGKDSPLTMAADNDYAVGELVDAVSHSPYWKDTAIFILEDDAQDGPDHVDCHRSTAYVVSAYTRRGYVDSHFYNTDSILHTMEVLMGVPPMTRFDKTATLLQLFTSKPDLSPYSAITPDKGIFAKNLKTAFGASLSKKMDFAIADDVDDDALNRVLWHDIKGKTAYPGIHELLR